MTRRLLPALLVATVAALPVHAQEMLDAGAMNAYITGKAYEGVNPETGGVVASVVYHEDGTSTLWMNAEGAVDEPGSYRIDGNIYCTRYDNFRENSENCFTLEDIGDGRTQALYTDGRTALILQPIEIPERFQ